MRGVLEVANVFRRHGAAYRDAHAGHLSGGQRRVMGCVYRSIVITDSGGR